MNRRRQISRIGLVILFIGFGTAGASGMTLIRTDWPVMVNESEAIVYGKIRQTRTYYDESYGMVFTEAEVASGEALKGGSGVSASVKFVVPGGVYNGETWDGPGWPKIEAGQTALVMLDDVEGRFWPFGLPMGIFQERMSPSGRSLLFNDMQDAMVVDMTTQIAAPTKPACYDVDGLKALIRRQVSLTPPALSAQMKEFDALYDRAGGVVVGRVESVESRDDPVRLVVTKVTLQVYSVIKGDVPAKLTMEIEGGETAKLKYVYSNHPRMAVYEDVLLFLERDADKWLPAGSSAKAAIRRRPDGRFEVLLEGGRIVLLDDMDFMKR